MSILELPVSGAHQSDDGQGDAWSDLSLEMIQVAGRRPVALPRAAGFFVFFCA